MTPRKRRERLGSIHEIADRLRQSADVAAPDLTNAILSQVHANRAFLDRRTRRLLWVGRAAIGVTVATVVLSTALLHRWSPGTFEVASRPAPLSSVLESVKSEASERLVGLRQAVDAAVPPTPVGTDDHAGQGGLLSLVSMAAPARAASVRPCAFCGPVIPPAQAARTVPASVEASEAPRTLASTKLSSPSSNSGAAMFAIAPVSGRFGVRMRFGDSAAASAAGTPGDRQPGVPAGGSVLRTISLNELAPLAATGSADSALAPK